MKTATAVAVLVTGVLFTGFTVGSTHGQSAVSPPPPMNADVKGVVAQYLLNHHGDVDGLLLADGTQIQFPPHMGRDLTAVAKPRDQVQIHGYHAEGVPVVQASRIVNSETGRSVAEREPSWHERPVLSPHMRDLAWSERHTEGTIRTLLYGPGGEMNGAVLNDGTIVRMPPHASAQVASILQPGQAIRAVGYGTENEHGRVMRATMIGAAGLAMIPLEDGGPRRPLP